MGLQQITAILCALSLATAALVMSCNSASAEERTPLLMEGKSTLYQRVLTTPSCKLTTSAEPSNRGKRLPAFSQYYVYGETDAAYEVGTNTTGNVVGFLQKDCVLPWNKPLSLVFTTSNQHNRALVFDEGAALDSIVTGSDVASSVSALYDQVLNQGHAEHVVSIEPEEYVDFRENFYLLPIFDSAEVSSSGDYGVYKHQVAAVAINDGKSDDTNADSAASSEDAGAGAGTDSDTSAAAADAASESKAESEAVGNSDSASHAVVNFKSAVVFVVDTSLSMQPYFDRTKQAINSIYQTIVDKSLHNSVQFGVVAFRGDTGATPGLEYTAKMLMRPSESTSADTFHKQIDFLELASVPSEQFNNDPYAGISMALEEINWNQYGGRYIVLITDSGAIDADDPQSSTGLDAQALQQEAERKGVAVYTLHLLTKEGNDNNNHASAQSQYETLSFNAVLNKPLYYGVNAVDPEDTADTADTADTEGSANTDNDAGTEATEVTETTDTTEAAAGSTDTAGTEDSDTEQLFAAVDTLANSLVVQANLASRGELSAGSALSATSSEMTVVEDSSAAVEGAQSETSAAADAEALPAAHAAVVFVIDSSLSMQPYLNSIKQKITGAYKALEDKQLNSDLHVGVVSLNSSPRFIPGVDFNAKIVLQPGEALTAEQIAQKLDSLETTKTFSKKKFSKDSYAGINLALNKIDWERYAERLIVLITDAGALYADDPLSSTGLDANDLQAMAEQKGVAIHTVHLLTEDGALKHNHASAKSQYEVLSFNTELNKPLYYSVDTASASNIDQAMDSVVIALANDLGLVATADADAEAEVASEAESSAEVEPEVDVEALSLALKLPYLGSSEGAPRHELIQGWISEADLVDSDKVVSTPVLLLTRKQINDMGLLMQTLLEAAIAGQWSSDSMMMKLQALATQMGLDPAKLSRNQTIGEMIIMGELLQDRHYSSRLSVLSPEDWVNLDSNSQETIIGDLEKAIQYLKQCSSDDAHFIKLNVDADDSEEVYPVLLYAIP